MKKKYLKPSIDIDSLMTSQMVCQSTIAVPIAGIDEVPPGDWTPGNVRLGSVWDEVGIDFDGLGL